MIETDLFEFAYVPDWYGQLEQLAEMALPESPYDVPEAEHRLQHRRNGIFPCGKQLCLLSYRTVHKTISGNLRLL